MYTVSYNKVVLNKQTQKPIFFICLKRITDAFEFAKTFWFMNDKYETGIRSCKQGLIIHQADKRDGLRKLLIVSGFCLPAFLSYIFFYGQSLPFSNICAIYIAVNTGRSSYCKISERGNEAVLPDPFDLILLCPSVHTLQHKIKGFEVEQSEYTLSACRSSDHFSGRP